MRIYSSDITWIDKYGALGINREYNEAFKTLHTDTGRFKNHPQYKYLIECFNSIDDAKEWLYREINLFYNIADKFNINYNKSEYLKKHTPSNNYLKLKTCEIKIVYEVIFRLIKYMSRRNTCVFSSNTLSLNHLFNHGSSFVVTSDDSVFYKYEKIKPTLYDIITNKHKISINKIYNDFIDNTHEILENVYQTENSNRYRKLYDKILNEDGVYF